VGILTLTLQTCLDLPKLVMAEQPAKTTSTSTLIAFASRLHSDFETLKAHLQAAETELNSTIIELKSTKTELSFATTQLNSTKSDLSSAQMDLNSAVGVNQTLTTDNAALVETVSKLNSDKAGLSADVTALHGNVRRLKMDNASLLMDKITLKDIVLSQNFLIAVCGVVIVGGVVWWYFDRKRQLYHVEEVKEALAAQRKLAARLLQTLSQELNFDFPPVGEDATTNPIGLHFICRQIDDVDATTAICGQGNNRQNCIGSLMPHIEVAELRAYVATHLDLMRGTDDTDITIDFKVAISLYCEGFLNIHRVLNKGFFQPVRTSETLQNQLPFVKLLVRSLRALGEKDGYYVGRVYRGARLQDSEYLTTIYNDFVTGKGSLRADIPIRFLSFTSTSTDATAAAKFGTDFFYIIDVIDTQGVSVARLSAFREKEVLLVPPAVFTVTNVEMVSGSIRVSLSGVLSTFRYL
jgi:outer membrane murein-binding lipoprotein Lpp